MLLFYYDIMTTNTYLAANNTCPMERLVPRGFVSPQAGVNGVNVPREVISSSLVDRGIHQSSGVRYCSRAQGIRGVARTKRFRSPLTCVNVPREVISSSLVGM